ncbi:MAG: HAD family hydrolase [bacterium]|nr:MAG: HAD family hydrolase [bacterium]
MKNSSEYIKSKNNIKGIFWDFDGTLVDTDQKNFNVTKKIVKEVTNRSPESFPVLKSIQTYQQALRKSTNWRDFYQHHFDLKNDQIDFAGSLWTQSQLSDNTPAPVFSDIPKTLELFSHINHGIISQNSRKLIYKIIAENNLQTYFNVIVGYEEVGLRNQKPDPAGFLIGIKKVHPQISGVYIYIGDHETDILFAQNVNNYFKANRINSKIFTVAVHYQSDAQKETWSLAPDFHAYCVADLESILNRNFK